MCPYWTPNWAIVCKWCNLVIKFPSNARIVKEVIIVTEVKIVEELKTVKEVKLAKK